MRVRFPAKDGGVCSVLINIENLKKYQEKHGINLEVLEVGKYEMRKCTHI